MTKLKLWMVSFARIITNSLVWFAPWSLLVLAVMPPNYQCWLVERNLFSAVSDWTDDQLYCISSSLSFSLEPTTPLWGILLVPIAALVTGLLKNTHTWNAKLRLALIALGLWLYSAIPLYFLWLAGKS